MGFALPAAIGTAFALAPRPVVMIAGDGGFQTNIQELQTVHRNGLPIKMIVMNNGCHGMVRQFQESYFDSRFQSTVIGYSAPDFAAVALAYGIPARSVDIVDDVPSALDWLWLIPEKPALLQVVIAPTVNALPKVMFGHPIMDMEPAQSIRVSRMREWTRFPDDRGNQNTGIQRSGKTPCPIASGRPGSGIGFLRR